MSKFESAESPRELIGRMLRSVFAAPTPAKGVEQLESIFERDIRLYVDGREFDWSWLEEHVRESYVRLRDVTIEVTHAVRDENVLMTRHMLTATASDTGYGWKMEVMGAYELSAQNKFSRIQELTRMHVGEYSHW
jgi:hypothetical protein